MFKGETAINTRVRSIGTTTKTPQFTATAPQPVELNMHANWLWNLEKGAYACTPGLFKLFKYRYSRKETLKTRVYP